MHRLGRETSGLVLFAKTPEARSALQDAWRKHAVVKRYRALAEGVCPDERLEIDTPIGPVPHPLLGTIHAASKRGKPSRSTAVVIERRADSTLFEVSIETGRPHQIRIHLASVGYPLVGDPIYAAGGWPRAESPGLPGDGGLFSPRRVAVVSASGNGRGGDAACAASADVEVNPFFIRGRGAPSGRR